MPDGVVAASSVDRATLTPRPPPQRPTQRAKPRRVSRAAPASAKGRCTQSPPNTAVAPTGVTGGAVRPARAVRPTRAVAANSASSSARTLGWHVPAEIGHEVRERSRSVKDHQSPRGTRPTNVSSPRSAHRVRTRGDNDQPGDLRPQVSIDAITPLFGQAHCFDAFFQHDLLRRPIESLIGQPAPMRLRPGRPSLGMTRTVASARVALTSVGPRGTAGKDESPGDPTAAASSASMQPAGAHPESCCANRALRGGIIDCPTTVQPQSGWR